MITKVIIKDIESTPISWCKKVFKGGEEFNFTPHVNIVIGENGSGKSTLMKLLASYTLCDKNLCSEFGTGGNDILHLKGLFWDDYVLGGEDDKFNDGVDVFSDYSLPTFNLRMSADINDYEFADSIHNFQLKMNGMNGSTGESTLNSISVLFKFMFGKEAPKEFPMEKIKKAIEKSNDVWSRRFQELVEYYEKHDIPGSEKTEKRVTILLDEPDRNLSIKYSKDLLGVLKTDRPDTQIIAVIHNPILINRLSNMKHVNIIELTPGYLKEVKEWATSSC